MPPNSGTYLCDAVLRHRQRVMDAAGQLHVSMAILLTLRRNVAKNCRVDASE